jgi:hypothetical protein
VGYQSFEGVAHSERSSNRIGGHTAHIFDQVDELSAGLIGKGLQRR